MISLVPLIECGLIAQSWMILCWFVDPKGVSDEVYCLLIDF